MFNLLAKLLARPRIADWIIERAQRTPYHHIQGEDGTVYMYRWWLFNPYPTKGWRALMPSMRVHRIMRADQDKHLHDHPWNARTFILRGWYTEDRPYAGEPLPPGVAVPEFYTYLRRAGDTVALRFGEYHRIEAVPPGGEVWTLFITGKKRGTWGFLVDGVKVPWRKYLGLPDA
jgi:hypothetical protein